MNLQVSFHFRSHFYINDNEPHYRMVYYNGSSVLFFQLLAELDELHRQLKSRHGSYGNSLSSVKMISQAFRIFEKSVQLIEGKVKNFSNTADTMIKDGRYDSRRIRREVDEVEQKWSDFHRSITEYHQALDDSTKFFELMDDVSENCSF